MKGFKIITSTLVLSLLSSFALASTLQSLKQSQINDELKGKTITTISLVTLNGSLVNNVFSGYFDNDGKLQGRLANQPDKGPMTDNGTWTVKPNGDLCATWEHWNDSKPICVSIYKVNNGLLFINDKNKMLETVVLDNNIKAGNQLG